MKRIFIAIVGCLFGCALFNKTSKTTTIDKQSSEKQLESSQLLFKTANKETQIFTYWNDSGFYQIQNIREQVNVAKTDKLKAEEKQLAKQETIVKKTEPLNFWVYIILLIGMLGCYWFFTRFVS
ncbi:hypothetical protein FBD94_05050 [Pedobacter hiemivivus]|uniref:Uncharacterized protein n=1 Tax=Pedobacter hiemivivus TaxID=2530454 RepID=A0A4R0NKF3_9SPHI|nr:hypothetical protein [Pedobacter hiemivivus]TCC99434.1 hypothetical protein EZ444_01795 [Pedobacter hiemivivus]TKC63717.1 hypothetical protein FBD94_05050 [Pedobacter hiemivivus]